MYFHTIFQVNRLDVAHGTVRRTGCTFVFFKVSGVGVGGIELQILARKPQNMLGAPHVVTTFNFKGSQPRAVVELGSSTAVRSCLVCTVPVLPWTHTRGRAPF